MKLLEYQAALAEMLAAMDEADFSEQETADAIESFLAGTEGLGAKLDAYAAVIADAEGKAYLRTLEIERLQKLVTTDKHLAEWLRSRLLSFMQVTGRDKIETELHKFRVQRNGGKAPMFIENGETIPERFWHERTVKELDKEALREALEAGAEVPGARIGERGTRLSIR